MVSQLVINVPGNGGLVTYDFSWQASGWTKAAEADPSFSAAAAGSNIVALDSPFFMGDGGTTFANDAEFFVDGLTITITNTLQPRSTPSAPHGIAGFHVVERRVTVSGGLWFGSLTKDATDTLMDTLNTSGKTMDCGLQVGRAAGAAMYVRWPALDFDADIGSKSGMDYLSFTAHATRSATQSTVPGAMRLHKL